MTPRPAGGTRKSLRLNADRYPWHAKLYDYYNYVASPSSGLDARSNVYGQGRADHY